MSTVDHKLGFELYLEGIKVPFSSITIQENENNYPRATISFPATAKVNNILAATVVQIFGPSDTKTSSSTDKVLLFEGEIQGISYQKGPQGRIAGIQCVSLLNYFEKATVRPKDALVSRQRTASDGSSIGGEGYIFMDNSNITGPLTNAKYQEMLQEGGFNLEVDNVINSLLESVGVSSFEPFVSSFIELMNGETEASKLIEEGQFHFFITYFLRFFERVDPFYGTISRGFKIPDSVFAWPNLGRTKPYKIKMIMENGLRMMSAIKQQASAIDAKLVQAISMFLKTMRYTMIAPSAPTYGYQFWRESGRQGPLRTTFMPNMEHSPPAMCNVFFPEQVTAFSYERNMAQEPTRVIGQLRIPTVSSLYMEQGLTPMAVAPTLGLNQEAIDKNSLGFTVEETYRGINSAVTPLDFYLTKVAMQQLTKLSEGENPNFTFDEEGFHFGNDFDVKELQGFGDAIQQMTLNDYLKRRYQGRMATAEVEWSPFRMVGMPGLILEENSPSIIGVVSSISTTIDANGSATSSISLRAPRLVDDEDKQFKNKEGTDNQLLGNIINDFTSDGFSDTNYFLFDPDLYNFTNIGTDIYNYLTYGQGSENGNKLNQESDKEGFSEFSDAINAMPASPVLDSSILRYVKNSDGDIESDLVVSGDPPETRYAKILVESISNLKEEYNKLKNTIEPRLIKSRLDRLNFRRLTKKVEYFSFVETPLVEDFSKAELSAYKDSVSLFKGLKKTEDLKQIINDTEIDQTIVTTKAGRINELNQLIEQKEQELSSSEQYLSKIQQGVFSKSKFINQQLSAAGQSSTRVGFKIPIIKADLVTEEELAKEYNNILNDRGDLTRQISSLKNEIEDLEQQVIELNESSQELNTLESEAFKIYNLIRRSHIELAFKDILKQGDINVIN